MTTTLDKAIKEVEDGIEDAKADFGDVSGDDIVREVVRAIAARLDRNTASELRRRYGV